MKPRYVFSRVAEAHPRSRAAMALGLASQVVAAAHTARPARHSVGVLSDSVGVGEGCRGQRFSSLSCLQQFQENGRE